MVKTRLAQRTLVQTRDRFRARCTPGPEIATRNDIHCTEAVCDARVGRSDGCLSTTQCHVRCVMVKTRLAQRSIDARSISRMVHTRTKKRYA